MEPSPKKVYEDFYVSIMNYIENYKPSTRDTMNFMGTIFYSLIEMPNMSMYDRSFYLRIYKKLIIKTLLEKETNDGKIYLIK